MIIDRLENRRYEKTIKRYKWLVIITLPLIIVRLALDPGILNNGAKLGDLLTTLLPLGFFIQYKATAKKWGGQFFEWRDSEVEFKSRKYDKTIISHESILQINIKLDIIEIQTKNKLFEINIEDYLEYSDRLRLKNNFKELSNRLSTSGTL
jgi:hypothetical protein